MKSVTDLIKLAKIKMKERPLFVLSINTCWNLLYALFHFILAAVYSSRWFLTLGAYFVALGLMRLLVLKIKEKKPILTSYLIGVSVIVLSIVVSGMMLLTIRNQKNPVRNEIIMIAIAVYTFALCVLAIRNIVVAIRRHAFMWIALRNISLVAAIGSMLSLERAMLGTFGDPAEETTRIIEISTGVVAFVLLISIGTGMIIYAQQMRKESSFK